MKPLQAKLHEIAKRHKPRGIKIRWKRKGLIPAHASINKKEILAPRPDTPEALYVFLHECAHFNLKHWNVDRDEYINEYEAERWAAMIMRLEGVPVPRRMVAGAKKYVRDCILEEKPTNVPGYIKKWLR